MKKFLLSIVAAGALTFSAHSSVTVAFYVDGTDVSDVDQTCQLTGTVADQTFTAPDAKIHFTKVNNSASNVNGSLVRWYQNDTMTLTALNGYMIGSVALYADTESYAAKCEVNNVEYTASTEGTVRYVTPISSDLLLDEITLHASAQVRFSKVVVTLEEDGENPVDPDQPKNVRISFPESSYSVLFGEAFQAPEPVADVDGLTFLYASSNVDVASVSPFSGEITINGIGTTEITVTSEPTELYNEGTASYTLNVLDPDAIVDLINTDNLSVSGYTNPVTYTSPLTNITYAGQTHKSNGFQFNTGKDDAVGIASTLNPDKYVISRIILNPGSMSGSQAANGVEVFLSNEAFASSGATSGTSVGVFSGTDRSVIIPEDDNFYFSIVPHGGVYVLESVEVEWRKAELTKEVAVASFPQTDYVVKLGEPFVAPVVETNTDAVPVYSSSNPNVATVDAETGQVSVLALGETVITVEFPETDDFFYTKADYTLVVADPEEAAFSIAFISNDSDATYNLTEDAFLGQVAAGRDRISSVSSLSNVYAGMDGLKMGSNNHSGEFTINLAEPISLDRINVTVSSMKTDDGSSLTVNGSDPVEITDRHQVVTYSFDGETVSSLSFKAQLVHLLAIDFYAAAEQPEKPEKKSAGLLFNEESVEVTLGEEFTAPVLDKATDAAVTYTSSNEEVATVDALSGEVAILAAGTTVITASAEETDLYLAGTAFYTLTVKEVSTPVDPVEPEPAGDIVVIEFKQDADGTSEISNLANLLNEVEAGAEYIAGVSEISKIFPGAKGLKFGSSKAAGSITLTLADQLVQREVKRISVTASSYDSKASTLSVNGISTLDVMEDFQVLNYTFDKEKIESISLASENRIYVNRIEIEYVSTGEPEQPKEEFVWEIDYRESFAEGEDEVVFSILLPEDFGEADGLFSWSCENEEDILVEYQGASAEVYVTECGEYDIDIVFSGNERYAASTETIHISVYPDATLAIGLEEGSLIEVEGDPVYFLPAYNEEYTYHYLVTEDAPESEPVFSAPARIPAEYTAYDHSAGITLRGIAGSLSLIASRNGIEAPARTLRYAVSTGVVGINGEEGEDRSFTLDGKAASASGRGVTITLRNGKAEKTIR